MKTAHQQRLADLLDVRKETGLLEPLSPTGGPLSPEPKQRQPYDELYLKLKYDRDYFNRN